MRIISQDRKISIEMRNAIIHMQLSSIIHGELVIIAYIDSKSFTLGRYESEKRLEEVFTDMHKAFSPVTIVTGNMDEKEALKFVNSSNVIHRIIKMDDPGKSITTYDDFIYYMPEK